MKRHVNAGGEVNAMNARQSHRRRTVSGARVRLRAGALALAMTAACGTALACELEDPSSIAARRGVLNLAYPESLHVGTAIWQAQLAGRLPRDPLATRGDLSPQARGALRLKRADAQLHRFAAKLAGRGAGTARPNLAVVLLGPVLWGRFDVTREGVGTFVHVAGPGRDDVVVVTDVAVIEAIAAGGIGVAQAMELGTLRLYGRAGDVAAARAWLVGRGNG